ncbi:hypothetical protein B0H14DRAFT_2655363 [Mycena olivaceomarginata]|nr:hypothetical protein B0H14DRAFT_2655363 [Mycena olivaceomarginata]
MPARTGNGVNNDLHFTPTPSFLPFFNTELRFAAGADTSGLIAAHLTRRRRLSRRMFPGVSSTPNTILDQILHRDLRDVTMVVASSNWRLTGSTQPCFQTVKTFILWIFAHMVQFLEDISVSFCSTAATCFKVNVVPVYTMAISSERVVQSQNSAYLKRLTDAINIPNPPHGILVEWRDIGERPHYRYNFNSMLGLFVTLTRFHFLAQHHILYVHRCWLA